jgi:hypothetical protein
MAASPRGPPPRPGAATARPPAGGTGFPRILEISCGLFFDGKSQIHLPAPGRDATQVSAQVRVPTGRIGEGGRDARNHVRHPVWAVLGPLYELRGAHVRRRRSFGCDAPIGLIYSINPFMIVLFVPLVGALTTGALGGSSAQRCAAARLAYRGHIARLPAELQSRTAPAGRPSRAAGYSPTRAGYQHFDMIHLGGYISALSPFWMVAFTSGAPWRCRQSHGGQPSAALLAARLGSASLRLRREVLGCAACVAMVYSGPAAARRMGDGRVCGDAVSGRGCVVSAVVRLQHGEAYGSGMDSH